MHASLKQLVAPDIDQRIDSNTEGLRASHQEMPHKQGIAVNITIEEAKKIWDSAQAREYIKHKPSGTIPDAVAESAISLSVSVDGQVDMRLRMQLQFSAKIENGKVLPPLTKDGIEVLRDLLIGQYGGDIIESNGAIYRSRVERLGFEKIGVLPGMGSLPPALPDSSPHSIEEFGMLLNRGPQELDLTKYQEIIFRPVEAEARNPETLQKIIHDGLLFFKSYIEAIQKQSGVKCEALTENLIVRAATDKGRRFAFFQNQPIESEKDVRLVTLRNLRDTYSIDSPIQSMVVRPDRLWEQAIQGKLIDTRLGDAPTSLSSRSPVVTFTGSGELRLTIDLDAPGRGDLLSDDQQIEIFSKLKEISENQNFRYVLENSAIYRIESDETAACVAIFPRAITAIDEKKLRQFITIKRKEMREQASSETTGEQSEGSEMKIEDCFHSESSKKLVLKSGIHRITNYVDFQAALEEMLLLAQIYLTVKKPTDKSSVPYESIVLKPLPTESEDRPTSQYNFHSLFSDLTSNIQTNELLRSIEAHPFPNVSFDQIIAQHKLVESLKTLVSQIKNPHHFAEFGCAPPDAVLLYGPPGNGKTTSAAAVATALQGAFINVSFKELLKHGSGKIENLIKELMDIAEEWADCHPSGRTIVFLDEIDVHLKTNERFDVLLRTHLSGLERSGKVIVIAATNFPETLSPGLRERFAAQLYVGNPQGDGIIDILQHHFHNAANGGMNRLNKEIDREKLKQLLHGYSARRIKDIVNYSLVLLAREAEQDGQHTHVTLSHIRRATEVIFRDDTSNEQTVVGDSQQFLGFNALKKLWHSLVR